MAQNHYNDGVIMHIISIGMAEKINKYLASMADRIKQKHFVKKYVLMVTGIVLNLLKHSQLQNHNSYEIFH